MHLDRPVGVCCYCGDGDNNRLIKNRMERTRVCVCVSEVCERISA